jgi:TPR repeat protein
MVGSSSYIITLMSTGDLTSARQLYERAAGHGDGRAALRMGETYDPAFLAQSRLNGARGDALLAARWYLRALELGVPDAAVLFKAVVSADRHSQPLTLDVVGDTRLKNDFIRVTGRIGNLDQYRTRVLRCATGALPRHRSQ